MVSKRLIGRLEIGIEVKHIYDWSKGRYGSPRIAKELQMQGKEVSKRFVARAMKAKNLKSVRVRRFKQTTNSKHLYSIVGNKLNQNFRVEQSNQAWASYITYIKTMEGWTYLTTVIDYLTEKL